MWRACKGVCLSGTAVVSDMRWGGRGLAREHRRSQRRRWAARRRRNRTTHRQAGQGIPSRAPGRSRHALSDSGTKSPTKGRSAAGARADHAGRIEIGLERVVADVEDAARLALVAAALLEDRPRIPHQEGARRVTGHDRRLQHLAKPGGDHGRQVLEVDLVAVTQGHRPLDDPFELAHVAWPVILAQGGQRSGRHPDGAFAPLPQQQVLDQVAQVVGVRAQRRHGDLDAVQAVKQVEAKHATLDHLVDIAVCRRDDADVNLDGITPADALDEEVLQHAQQLGLGQRRKVADLVEEQRPAVSKLELPAPSPDTRWRRDPRYRIPRPRTTTRQSTRN